MLLFVLNVTNYTNGEESKVLHLRRKLKTCLFAKLTNKEGNYSHKLQESNAGLQKVQQKATKLLTQLLFV